MLDKILELYGNPMTKSNILVQKIGENSFSRQFSILSNLGSLLNAPNIS